MHGKVVIIGAGHVGSHVARALMAGQGPDEIVLVDILPGKAESQAMDIMDALSYPPAKGVVRSGTYEDCATASLTVIAIGKAREPGQTRLDLLSDSTRMIFDLAMSLRDITITGPVICITNPCDIMADCMRRLLNLDRFQVFGTGTLLDTARLLRTLSEQTGCSTKDIAAWVLGEHGDSSMVPFSSVMIAGREASEFPGYNPEEALRRTHEIGMDIINGKGSTEFGIGQVTAFLIRSILTGSGVILPLSVHLEGEYDLNDVQCGVPCVTCKSGIKRITQLPLTDEEQLALRKSAGVIEQYTRQALEIIDGLMKTK